MGRNLFKSLLALGIVLTIFLTIQLPARADIFKKEFNDDQQNSLIVEILDDDLAHFEFSTIDNKSQDSIYTSPMVLKTDYTGPSTPPKESGSTIETSDLRIAVNPGSLCLTLSDKTKSDQNLTTVCPVDLDQPRKGIDINPGEIEHIYGLGQKFVNLADADGDWTSLGIREGGQFGNAFDGFQEAAVGNVQIPVYYAIGPDNLNYALFMDNVYRQKWDFNENWWQAQMFGDQLRFYFMTGSDLPDLRADFMELTGTPPVPPKKALGLWVSEFGYDNWTQTDKLRDTLREDKFPFDGFVLDLNWFGGIAIGDASKSNMGRLNWDENQNNFLNNNNYFFPDPDTKIKEYADDDIRLTAIEESYLANTVDTFNQMPSDLTAYRRTNNVCDNNNQSNTETNVTGFWGEGRMIDWSDPKAGKWINDNRRFPNLVSKGIDAHWTDLGEPETFESSACYEGVETTTSGIKNEHSDIHNLYNLLWNKSIWDGYADKQGETDNLGVTNPRPFIVTRSGSAGTQRYGTAMWSGDIASNLKSLATHSNAQMHMSFSGIDYYGSDIGGFRREVMPSNNKPQNGPIYTGYEDELYTQWFANGSWFDVPVRPHTDNEFTNNTGCSTNFGKRQPPCYETSPNLLGKVDSNLANIRQRYELLPFYYSLAYGAYLKGEPIVPPPVFYYQNDPNVAQMGNEKMIGKDMLVGIVSSHGEYERDMYLPEGEWVNYYSNEWFDSNGETLEDVPVYRDGIFLLPAFVRAGAIIPQMFVDENTKDAFGNRLDGANHDELIVSVYADQTPSDFTLYEDDGLTLNYDENNLPFYHYRTTTLKQQQDGNKVTVNIEPAVNIKGDQQVSESFSGAVTSRSNVVKLIVNDAKATAVNLNGIPLTKHDSKEDFEIANSGWYNAGNNLIVAKSGEMNVYNGDKTFSFKLQPLEAKTSVNLVCDAGFTTFGQSIYAVGNIDALGNWNPANAVKLDPNIYYEYISNPPSAPPGSEERPGPTKPIWTGVINNLPPSTTFEWKCIRRQENDPSQVEFQPGNNNKVITINSGYSGHSIGSF